MGGDRLFWYFFSGVLVILGAGFLFGGTVGTFNAAPAAGDHGAPPWIFAVIGLPLGAAGVYLFRRTMREAAHDRHLMQSGFAQTATITEVRESRIRINRQPRWNVIYRYEYAGRTYDGESRMFDERLASQFAAGGIVQIKLDPANPGDSVFLGKK